MKMSIILNHVRVFLIISVLLQVPVFSGVFSWTAPDGKLYVFDSREKLEQARQKYQKKNEISAEVKAEQNIETKPLTQENPVNFTQSVSERNNTQKTENEELQNIRAVEIQQDVVNMSHTAPAEKTVSADHADRTAKETEKKSGMMLPVLLSVFMVFSAGILLGKKYFYVRREESRKNGKSIQILCEINRELL